MSTTQTHPLSPATLRQFSGSEDYFFNPMFRSVNYTDGVKYINQYAGWVVTDILAHLVANPKLRGQEFISATLSITGKEGEQVGKLTLTDGDTKVLDIQEYPIVVGIPNQDILFFYTNNVLMISSEY